MNSFQNQNTYESNFNLINDSRLFNKNSQKFDLHVWFITLLNAFVSVWAREIARFSWNGLCERGWAEGCIGTKKVIQNERFAISHINLRMIK